MKRFILYAAICCWLVNASAQTIKENVMNNVCLSASNRMAYPTPSGEMTPAPKGYTPFHIDHYARHGSRFLIRPKQYDEPLAIFKEAKQNGVLTAKGEEVLVILDSMANMAKGRYGELTVKGARQHKGIGERMGRNFPEVFKGDASIDARSTVIIRCILSMVSECQALKAMYPDLKMFNDASEHDMYYMNDGNKEYSKCLKPEVIDRELKAFTKEHMHPERFMKSMFNSEEYIKWKIDSETLMQQMFVLACNMQSHDTDMNLYQYFTPEECYNLWLIDNVNWYLNFGPSPANRYRRPFMESNLLKNMLASADEAVKTGKKGATMRFGHEVCVLPLVCLLELGNFGYNTEDLNNLHNQWRNYEIFPMASNVQLIFYRKKGSDDVLVKALLNEEEISMPVATDVAPYYHWKDLKAYYQAKLNAFDKEWENGVWTPGENKL